MLCHSPAPRSVTGVRIIHTCILTHLHHVCTHLVPNHPHLSQHLHIPHSPCTRCLVSHFKRKHSHWISHDLAFRRITFSSIILSFSLVPLLSSCFEYYLSDSLVKCLAECDSCFVCRNGVFCYSLFIKRLPLLSLVWRLDRECHQCPAVLRACAPPRVE